MPQGTVMMHKETWLCYISILRKCTSRLPPGGGSPRAGFPCVEAVHVPTPTPPGGPRAASFPACGVAGQPIPRGHPCCCLVGIPILIRYFLTARGESLPVPRPGGLAECRGPCAAPRRAGTPGAEAAK